VRVLDDAITVEKPEGMSESVVESLRSFYAGHRQQLYTYAISITRHRESAEDAIHQAFQQLLRRGTLPVDFRPYVFRCVRNAALDGLRRARVRSDPIFAETLEPRAGPARAGGPLLASEVDEALRALSADEREVIVMKIYDALTFQEIADVLDSPLPTVASWYRRGLEKIRTMLTKEMP
jgi:RNA polymerase sigma-70 factor (ECF subfamily)